MWPPPVLRCLRWRVCLVTLLLFLVTVFPMTTAYYGRQRVRFGNRFQAILLAFFFYFFLDGRLGLLHRVQLS